MHVEIRKYLYKMLQGNKFYSPKFTVFFLSYILMVPVIVTHLRILNNSIYLNK